MRLGTAIKLTLGLALAATLGIVAHAANRPETINTASYLGSYTWQINAKWFGGLSALSLSPDGCSMTILSDRATLATAQIDRDVGQISGIEIKSVHKLRASTGGVLKGFTKDSEGLAIAPDGTIYVSFEGISRVARHRKASSRAEVLPRPKAFRRLPINKALEALASDARGHLYTLPENALNSDGQIPVWRWNGRKWSTPFTLPPKGGFFPVSADFGPDGRFYLLERDYGFFGFRSRLRRWDFTEKGPKNEQILLQTSSGRHDNLEGLSVWRDATGRLRATMVSDDNFLILQRTELVEYSLPD
ncbi:esterase-like activity of phytase family protein [Parasedimentitalea marina]|uniref:Esterase-like activity of phytase family protein n=1 Tax=Parasedimentitalea marina TaxID=2483033 RepID=A0A3T0MXH7_9RHOB|nr:esterase-like activity of phytase family protein [Parasedimentitalea marina]AZV76457.1 esterase-like activity of phytase family protein [Parasedimentitalea marina]